MSIETPVNPFVFKQFVINQERVPMKVGTDGVLVGTWAGIKGKKVLDVGTGSGLIALMMAQRIVNAEIHAIDVDALAIDQANENFMASPWAQSFSLHHQSIQEFSKECSFRFDLIISNPPFFTGGMTSPTEERNMARHTTKLPHGDLLQAVDRLLANDGTLVLILPFLQGLRFMEISQTYRLYPSRITEVFTKPGKNVERLLLEFVRRPVTIDTNRLIIQDDQNEYTTDYKTLTKDFYLNF